jgi:2-polyprenyl-3-methyl-5-hydroxy-6-metoxy-1,4-benzoquinol methylase
MASLAWSQNELEFVPCDLCGSGEFRTLFTRPDRMTVVECMACGLAFLNPRPKRECIGRLYDAMYFQKSSPHSECGYSDYLSEDYRWIMFDLARVRLAPLKSIWAPRGKRCLEIGCATGEFCDLLANSGAVTTGVDLSTFVIQKAREWYPSLDFRSGAIEVASGSRKYDAVFGFELIEHVISPKQFLFAIMELITDAGIFVLTTPNLECGRKVGFDKWLGFNASFEHLYFFSSETLQRYARLVGFEIAQWRTGGGDGIVHPPVAIHQHPLKRAMMRTLRHAGLLDTARRLRRSFRPCDDVYQDHGEQHNLFVIFNKTKRPAPVG